MIFFNANYIFTCSQRKKIRDYVVLYNNTKQEMEGEINQWRLIARNVRDNRLSRLEDIDR